MSDKERYHKYLCSPEWWAKRNAVLERSRGRSSVPHPFRILVDEAYAHEIGRAFARCDSPIEGDLLHCLLKRYDAQDIFQQYQVGRFRLDFVTADAVGWELDGKKWHDPERDFARDTWIFANSEIRQIVRVEAAAMKFFRDAVLAVFGHFVSHFAPAKETYGMDADRARWEADRWVACTDEDGYPCQRAIDCYGTKSMLDTMQFKDAYEVKVNTGYVGTPLAFVDDGHEIWKYVEPSRRGLCRFKCRVTKRIR
jgi:very-short-patch-repair endonuclease